jgi:hypothetical protein
MIPVSVRSPASSFVLPLRVYGEDYGEDAEDK